MAKVSDFDNFGVEDMDAAQTKERQAYVLERCKCEGCPSFVQGDEFAGFCFPAFGTSDVIKHEKDCLCRSCPVYGEYELNHTFYCTRCSQHCQAFKSEVGGGHE